MFQEPHKKEDKPLVAQVGDQWLEDRKKGIGGSDIGCILGLNKWKTPLMVWEEKTGRRNEVVDNDLTRSGHRLEPVVADWFAESTGLQLINPGNHVMKHKTHDWCIGTPDRITHKGNEDPATVGVLEIKTTGQSFDISTIPPYWFTQANWYAGIYRSNYSQSSCMQNYIAWFERVTGHFDSVPLDFDPSFFQYMVDQAGQFWENYVLKDTPPPPVNSDDVLRLYPKHLTGKTIEASRELIEIIERLHDANARLKEAKQAKDEIDEKIKFIMCDAEAVMVDGAPAVTWKSGKDTVAFDMDKFAIDHPELYIKYATTKPGVRRFLIK